MEVTVEGRTLPNDRQGRLGIHFADSNSHESTAPRLPRLHLGPADLPEIAEPSGGSTLDSPHDLHSNPGRARDGPRSAPSPYQTQAGGRSLAAWHRAESGRTSRDWRECAACGAIIANALLMMEVYPQTKDKKAVRFHGDCYTLWKIRDSGTRPTSAAQTRLHRHAGTALRTPKVGSRPSVRLITYQFTFLRKCRNF
jgi:hypothetical protein